MQRKNIQKKRRKKKDAADPKTAAWLHTARDIQCIGVRERATACCNYCMATIQDILMGLFSHVLSWMPSVARQRGGRSASPVSDIRGVGVTGVQNFKQERKQLGFWTSSSNNTGNHRQQPSQTCTFLCASSLLHSFGIKVHNNINISTATICSSYILTPNVNGQKVAPTPSDVRMDAFSGR